MSCFSSCRAVLPHHMQRNHVDVWILDECELRWYTRPWRQWCELNRMRANPVWIFRVR